MPFLHKDFGTCVLEVEESGVATLTLTDEAHLNPFNDEILRNILAAIILLRQTAEAQVLVVTGSGLAFSTGGDLKLLPELANLDQAKWTFDAASYAVNLFYDLEIPVIAAVNGIVAGAALALMMSCDLIVASEHASLLFSFRQIAFTPDSGTSYFLVRKLGYHKAAEILLFGQQIGAAQALELGLFNQVVPAADLLPEAKKWAERIARGPMKTMVYDKKLLRAALTNNLYQQQELEAMYQLLAWSSDDFREGIAAFSERRRPQFTGKSNIEYRGGR